MQKHITDLRLEKLTANSVESQQYKGFYYLYNHPDNNVWMYYATRSAEDFFPIFQRIYNASTIYLLKGTIDGKEEVLGCCRLIKGENSRSHQLEIASVTINPKFHKNGLGKQLFNLLEETIKETFPEIIRLELSYGFNNPVAKKGKFYNKLGYQDEYQTDAYFLPKEAVFPKEDNLYADWLAENGEDIRRKKHFFYAVEMFTGKLLLSREEKYQPSRHRLQRQLVIPEFSEDAKSHNYRTATFADISSLIQIYKNSVTDWSYKNESELSSILENEINEKRISVVCSADSKILAACAIVPGPDPIEHITFIDQIVLLENRAPYIQTLLAGVIFDCKNKYPKAKKFEISIPDNNQPQELFDAIQQCGFEYGGTKKCSFKTKEGQYLDELGFSCLTFGLDDAITCCERRLGSEKYFLENPQKSTFDLVISQEVLESLLQHLQELQSLGNNNANYSVGIVAFRVVHTLCTQDYITANERYEQVKKIEASAAPLIQKFPQLTAVFDDCRSCLNNLKSLKVNMGFFNPGEEIPRKILSPGII